MKKNKNPERLRELKKDWWWRRLIFTKFIEPTPANRKPSKPYSTQARKGLSEMSLFHYHQWKGGIERICYTYELYRRTADVPEAILPFLMPFHRLNDRSLEFFVKSKIDTYLTKQSHLGVFFNDSSINEMSDSFPAGMFWLRQRKDKLLSQFWKEIEKQRKIKKLFDEIPKNAGNSNRSVSWKAVELLDEKCNKILKPSEFECIRLQRRHSEHLFPLIESAFNDYISFCSENGKANKSEPLINEWIRKL